jgi:hypothetical protein
MVPRNARGRGFVSGAAFLPQLDHHGRREHRRDPPRRVRRARRVGPGGRSVGPEPAARRVGRAGTVRPGAGRRVSRVSLLLWRVKGHQTVLSLLASRVDLVEKRVAGQQSKVEEEQLALLLAPRPVEVHAGRMELVAPGPEASGGKSGASGPCAGGRPKFDGARLKFDEPTVSSGGAPLWNARWMVREAVPMLEKRHATVRTTGRMEKTARRPLPAPHGSNCKPPAMPRMSAASLAGVARHALEKTERRGRTGTGGWASSS